MFSSSSSSSSKLKSSTPDRAEVNETTKKPPLPTILSRKNSLTQRYSSWNKIHLNEFFSLNRQDTIQNRELDKSTRASTLLSSSRVSCPGFFKSSGNTINTELKSNSDLIKSLSFRRTQTITGSSKLEANNLSTSNLLALKKQCKLQYSFLVGKKLTCSLTLAVVDL